MTAPGLRRLAHVVALPAGNHDALPRRSDPVVVDFELGTEEVDLDRWAEHYIAMLLREDPRDNAQGTSLVS